MVPLDKPAEALAMISAFVQHQPLLGGAAPGGRPRRGPAPLPATVIQSVPDKREKRETHIRNRAKSQQS